jgi:anion-transporting  ArsA/GET3 family ATPase
VLGSQFLQDIAEFFLNFQSMYDGFVVRAQAVERLLHDRRTTFSVVTTLEGAPWREAEFFCRELTARGFPLGAMVLNRVLPAFLTSAEGQAAATVLCDRAESLAGPLAELGVDAFDDPDRTARVLRIVGSTFRDYAVVATREADLRAGLARAPDIVASVPAFTDDIHDVAGLARISRALLASP